MPQMKRVGAMKDAIDTNAALPEATRQIVVFAAPAFELLVVTIDSLVVGSPDPDIVADERRFAGMSNPAMPPSRPMATAETTYFGGWRQAHVPTRPQVLGGYGR